MTGPLSLVLPVHKTDLQCEQGCTWLCWHQGVTAGVHLSEEATVSSPPPRHHWVLRSQQSAEGP